MKLKEGLTLRKLAGEYIIVQPELGQQDMANVFTLNEVSAFLWEQIIGQEFSAEDLVQLLLDHYDVTEEEASADVKALLDSFVKHGLVSV